MIIIFYSLICFKSKDTNVGNVVNLTFSLVQYNFICIINIHKCDDDTLSY